MTRIRWDQKSIRELRTDPRVVGYVAEAARNMADLITDRAPQDTGGGAASIAARPSRARGATDVGWDASHFYMIFPEFGTQYQDAQRFARDVLYAYQHLGE
jgi:HK97 gp10 family phage protein